MPTRTVVLEKTLESPLDCKENKPVNPKGNQLDKEFQIMIVKMIQNLENKKELQINSLETRIERMQERFNKDIEEIKKSIYNE